MKRDIKLIKELKKMSLDELGTLLNTSTRLGVYYMSISNLRASDREIYIQSEITKERNRRKLKQLKK